jgi:prepilin-type N-terminal cleavage/methylation domain-containing protein
MRPSDRPSRRAFTLVEILCVVLIIGIAAAVVVPQIASSDDLKAAAAARVVMADLLYAQNRAITFQRAHYVRFDVDANQYSLLSAPGLTLLTHPVNKTTYVTRFGASGLGAIKDSSLLSASFRGISGQNQLALAFDELGTPLAYNTTDGTTETLQSGAIVIQSGTEKLQIAVEAYTGQITVDRVP